MIFTLILYGCGIALFLQFWQNVPLSETMLLPKLLAVADDGSTSYVWSILQLTNCVLQAAACAMGLLVIPVLLKLNGLSPHHILCILGLVLLSQTTTSSQATSEQKMILPEYLFVHLIAGWLAGRWMQTYFPEDPTIERLMQGKR